jgi:SPP1 gp7 family putative phage head morphogenesis protein
MKNFDEILDISVRHRIFLQRLAANHEKELAKLLSAGGRDKAAIVRDGLDVALAEGKFTRRQAAILAKMEKELGRAIGSTVDSAKDWYIRELDDLVQNEIEGASKILAAGIKGGRAEVLKLPALASVKRLTETTPYSGYTIEQWFSGTSETAMRRIMARVRVGIANGESIDQMVMAIRGTPAAKYADGIFSGYTESQARTIARTLTNGVSNAAYQDVFAENKELIAYERYTATLDSRTTLVCASLDGNTYKVGEGPVPPLHPNCRSLRIAITEGMAEDAKRGESGLANRQSYQEWLKRQPEWMQKEVLGETRQKLFAEGKMTLDKFIDHNGQTYTLDQLKKVDEAAFKRAGIE